VGSGFGSAAVTDYSSSDIIVDRAGETHSVVCLLDRPFVVFTCETPVRCVLRLAGVLKKATEV
jgi:hypothetical protein